MAFEHGSPELIRAAGQRIARLSAKGRGFTPAQIARLVAVVRCVDDGHPIVVPDAGANDNEAFELREAMRLGAHMLVLDYSQSLHAKEAASDRRN